MSHDAYVKFAGIEARSDDPDMPGWARLWSFHHTVQQTAVGSASLGDAGPGRADHGDFQITKAVDEASPRLALCCCSAVRLGSVTVEIHDTSQQRQKFMQYQLNDVMVRSIGATLPEPNEAGAGTGRILRETIALRYREIIWTYTILQNGSPQGDVQCRWNIATNLGG